MSSASGIRAGRAYVEIGTDDSRLVAGLRQVSGKLKAFGRSMSIAGAGLSAASAAILGPMVAASSAFAASGDELSKMSDKTGASVESLSELRHAASQSAVEFSQLGSALAKQQKNLAEAATGNKTAAEAFQQLGLSVEDLLKLAPDQQFEAIADRIAMLEDPALRTKAAMDVFGKSGAELMPLMIAGANGIKTLREEARKLGLQVSAEDAAAATLLGDTWANTLSIVKDVGFEIGASLAGSLTDALKIVNDVLASVSDFIHENRELVLTVAAVAAGVGAAGAALVFAGGAFAGVGLAIEGVIAVGGVLAAVVAAAVSPIWILAGVVVAAGGAFLFLTEAGQKVLGWFGEQFGELYEIVSGVIGDVFSAIAGGQWDLAGKLAMSALQIAFQSGANLLERVWLDFSYGFQEVWMNAVGAVTDILKKSVAGWMLMATEAYNFLEDIGGKLAVTASIGKLEVDKRTALMRLDDEKRYAETWTPADEEDYKKRKQQIEYEFDMKAVDLEDASLDEDTKRKQAAQDRLDQIVDQTEESIRRDAEERTAAINEMDAKHAASLEGLDANNKKLQDQIAAYKGHQREIKSGSGPSGWAAWVDEAQKRLKAQFDGATAGIDFGNLGGGGAAWGSFSGEIVALNQAAGGTTQDRMLDMLVRIENHTRVTSKKKDGGPWLT